MADFTNQELQMMVKYYGRLDLADDDLFWLDCLMNYQDKILPLPIQDTPEARRHLKELLVCPPGQCSACCRYKRTTLTDGDLKRFTRVGIEATIAKEDELIYLDCSDGCEFLSDNRCSIYENRPDVCCEYPIQAARDASLTLDGSAVKQAQYRIKCEASLSVVRTIIKEAIGNSTALLLPDLTLVPLVKSVPETFEKAMAGGKK